MTGLVLLARIADQRVAFDATAIEAVVDIADVVPVPFAPDGVLGLSAIRSQVVTVIDCAHVVGGQCAPAGRALIVSIDGHRYALRVSAVEDVVAIGAASGPISGEAAALMAPAWRSIAVGRVDLADGFAVLVAPSLFLGASTIAIAA
jgi:purine-binding chemotaxis protein CheW